MTAKSASTSAIVITTAIGTILLIVWGLLGYWNSQSQPTTYIVVSVERNTDTEWCDDPYITVVKDSTTGQISDKCGDLGQHSAIIALDE